MMMKIIGLLNYNHINLEQANDKKIGLFDHKHINFDHVNNDV
jgi:hypothetical protein